jgi:hypothetical protein
MVGLALVSKPSLEFHVLNDNWKIASKFCIIHQFHRNQFEPHEEVSLSAKLPNSMIDLSLISSWNRLMTNFFQQSLGTDFLLKI